MYISTRSNVARKEVFFICCIIVILNDEVWSLKLREITKQYKKFQVWGWSLNDRASDKNSETGRGWCTICKLINQFCALKMWKACFLSKLTHISTT